MLDEADKLLEGCFAEDVEWIAGLCRGKQPGGGGGSGGEGDRDTPTAAAADDDDNKKTNNNNHASHYPTTPSPRHHHQPPPHRCQMMALSATFPPPTLDRLHLLMHNPHHIRLTPQHITLRGVAHYYHPTPRGDDTATQRRAAWLVFLRRVLSRVLFNQAVVFCNRRQDAEWLARSLVGIGFAAAYMAGDQGQVWGGGTVRVRVYESGGIGCTEVLLDVYWMYTSWMYKSVVELDKLMTAHATHAHHTCTPHMHTTHAPNTCTAHMHTTHAPNTPIPPLG